MKNNRLNNIELLRIITMIMVLILHFFNFGGFLAQYNDNNINSIIVWTFESLSFVAVNCYVLISGYFLINSQFKKEKLFRLIIEVLFYSIIIYILMIVTQQIEFSFLSFSKSIFPILLGNYWFITCYVVLYILSPFLNKFIKSLSKHDYKSLIILLTAIFSIWATVIPNSETINYGGSYSISWFICLYLIAGYLRLYFDFTKIKNNRYLAIYLLCSIINVITYFLIPENPYIKNDFLYNYYSISMLVASISLFIFFINIKIENKLINKTIASFSSTTFGIYLIHENPNIRSFLWGIFNNITLEISENVVKLILSVFIVPILLFVIFAIIDKVRDFIFNIIYKITKKEFK